MPAPFTFQPERNETVLQVVIIQQLYGAGHIAVIPHGFMQVQHAAQLIFPAPADEVIQQAECPFPVLVRLLLQHDLIEAHPDMIHAEGGDVRHIIFRDITFKMFVVADGQQHFPFFRQDLKTLVVGQPAADAHTLFPRKDPIHVIFSLFPVIVEKFSQWENNTAGSAIFKLKRGKYGENTDGMERFRFLSGV